MLLGNWDSAHPCMIKSLAKWVCPKIRFKLFFRVLFEIPSRVDDLSFVCLFVCVSAVGG